MKRVVVYGASSSNIPAAYLEAARQLGEALAQRGVQAVCGGGRGGVMAAVIDGQLACGGNPIGVLPSFMIERGWAHEGLSEPVVTETMHERKAEMLRLADTGAVAMPGGIGTFEELTEAITWRQLGLYTHPVVVMNIDGYYNPLLEQLEQARRQGLMRDRRTDLWAVATSVEECLTHLFADA